MEKYALPKRAIKCIYADLYHHLGEKKAEEVMGLLHLWVEEESHAPFERYDAGILNDWGGGNVEWWQDYIRSELDRAHEFYEGQSWK